MLAGGEAAASRNLACPKALRIIRHQTLLSKRGDEPLFNHAKWR